MLIKPGEILTYWLEVASGEEAVAQVWLEYTQDGGLRWVKEKDENGADIDWTGTAGSTLTGSVDIGTVKNETGKNKLYRWRCVSINKSYDNILWALKNNAPNRVHLYGDIYHIWSEDTPEGGLDGDGLGFAGRGSLYTVTAHPHGLYRNEGSQTSPNWVRIG